MRPDERSKDVTSLLPGIVSAVGLLVFVYAGSALVFLPISLNDSVDPSPF
jgi:hypothetical protein